LNNLQKWRSVEQFLTVREDILLGTAILKGGIQLLGPFVSAKKYLRIDPAKSQVVPISSVITVYCFF